MKIGIYNSNTGDESVESSLVFLAESLSRRNEVEIICHGKVPLLDDFLPPASLNRIRIRQVDEPPQLVTDPGNPALGYQRVRDWGEELTQSYDLFINYSDCCPIYNAALRGVLLVQFPQRWTLSPYRWLWHENFKSYQLKLVSSYYARLWTKILWDVDSEVVRPSFHPRFSPGVKEKLIFCADGPTENHCLHEAIKKLQIRLPDWNVINGQTNYANQGLASNLARASIYIRFQEDIASCPPRVVPVSDLLQVMHAGCVPLVNNIGSYPEIIRHGESGFFWDTPDQLLEYAFVLTRDSARRKKMAKAAQRRAQCFGKETYVKTVLGHLQTTFGIKQHNPLNPALVWQRIKNSTSQFLSERKVIHNTKL